VSFTLISTLMYTHEMVLTHAGLVYADVTEN